MSNTIEETEMALANLQAVAWYEKHDIEARIVNGAVYIGVDNFEIEVSTGEVLYRSELFKEENN